MSLRASDFHISHRASFPTLIYFRLESMRVYWRDDQILLGNNFLAKSQWSARRALFNSSLSSYLSGFRRI